MLRRIVQFTARSRIDRPRAAGGIFATFCGAIRWSGVCALVALFPFRAQGADGADAGGGPDITVAATAATDTEAPPDAVTDLRQRVADLEAELKQTQELIFKRLSSTVQITGYADIGFFVPQGNGGAGYIEDYGNHYFPQYAGKFGWVFLGDELAPTVNSRGEAADLGNAPGFNNFDSIHSGGAASFIVNEVNLGVRAGLSKELLLRTSIDFVPRTGSNYSLGDFFDLDIAQLEWVPEALGGNTSFFVGKFDSVMGIEYKDRKSTDRFGITPSLTARYTTGTPIGLKVRTKLFNDTLILALAVTNGNSTTEQFGFYEEIATRNSKTLSGRAAVRLRLGPSVLEAGAFGLYGSQDRQSDNDLYMWFLGGDLQLSLYTLSLKAQIIRGMAPGNPTDGAWGLNLSSGGFLEADWMATPMIGVLGRGEWRDALVWLGDQWLFLTREWRATVGLRFVLSHAVTVKAEYLFNEQFGGVPHIPSNVFTTSLVLIY
jgi:hypothetical protein